MKDSLQEKRKLKSKNYILIENKEVTLTKPVSDTQIYLESIEPGMELDLFGVQYVVKDVVNNGHDTGIIVEGNIYIPLL